MKSFKTIAIILLAAGLILTALYHGIRVNIQKADDPNLIFSTDISRISPFPDNHEESSKIVNELFFDRDNYIAAEFEEIKPLLPNELNFDEKNFDPVKIRQAWDSAPNIRKLVDELYNYDSFGVPHVPLGSHRNYRSIFKSLPVLLKLYLLHAELMKREQGDYLPDLARLTKIFYNFGFYGRNLIDFRISVYGFNKIHNTYGRKIYLKDPGTYLYFEKWAENWKDNFIRAIKCDVLSAKNVIDREQDIDLSISSVIDGDIMDKITEKIMDFFMGDYFFQYNKTFNNGWKMTDRISDYLHSGQYDKLNDLYAELSNAAYENKDWKNRAGDLFLSVAIFIPEKEELEDLDKLEKEINAIAHAGEGTGRAR